MSPDDFVMLDLDMEHPERTPELILVSDYTGYALVTLEHLDQARELLDPHEPGEPAVPFEQWFHHWMIVGSKTIFESTDTGSPKCLRSYLIIDSKRETLLLEDDFPNMHSTTVARLIKEYELEQDEQTAREWRDRQCTKS